MNYEQTLQDIAKVYETNCGEKISVDDSAEVLRALLSVRDTAQILETAPRHLLQVVFENRNFHNKCVYACDIIELRGMLGKCKINTQSKIILFSKACADRVIRDHKVKLMLNCDPHEICKKQNLDCKCFGGVSVIDSNSLDIAGFVSCIIVESKGYEQVETVEAIIKEFELPIPVYTTSIISGIDKYKFASNKNKYVVNLSSLGIKNRISRADTPIEALDEELKKRWNFHPDSDHGKNPRPDNYYASYWEKSPFMGAIVKEASSDFHFKGEWNGENLGGGPSGRRAYLAIMDVAGTIYVDTDAVMHGDLVESFNLEPSMIVDGGFVVGDVYQSGTSDGGYSHHESDDSSDFQNAIKNRDKYNKPQVKISKSNMKNTFNLAKFKKQADVTSGSQFGTGGRMSGEGSTMDFIGVKSMKRYEPGASAAIAKGDVYYSKDGGIIGNGKKYVVVGIYSDNTVMLKDEHGKKLKVDIAVALPAKFRKA
jgi:hypothetical protein